MVSGMIGLRIITLKHDWFSCQPGDRCLAPARQRRGWHLPSSVSGRRWWPVKFRGDRYAAVCIRILFQYIIGTFHRNMPEIHLARQCRPVSSGRTTGSDPRPDRLGIIDTERQHSKPRIGYREGLTAKIPNGKNRIISWWHECRQIFGFQAIASRIVTGNNPVIGWCASIYLMRRRGKQRQVLS